MTKQKRLEYKREFLSLIEDDPDFDYKPEDFNEWLIDHGIIKPKIKVFDNGGKTNDRYTVIIGSAVFTMNSNPLDPGYGFNQYCCEVGDLDPEKSRAETPVKLKALPEEVRRAITLRVKNYNNI